MSSKVIKWFIRQASIRRPDKEDKTSATKSNSEEKKKLSFPRLSFRKRNKRRNSSPNMSGKEENGRIKTSDSCTPILVDNPAPVAKPETSHSVNVFSSTSSPSKESSGELSKSLSEVSYSSYENDSKSDPVSEDVTVISTGMSADKDENVVLAEDSDSRGRCVEKNENERITAECKALTSSTDSKEMDSEKGTKQHSQPEYLNDKESTKVTIHQIEDGEAVLTNEESLNTTSDSDTYKSSAFGEYDVEAVERNEEEVSITDRLISNYGESRYPCGIKENVVKPECRTNDCDTNMTEVGKIDRGASRETSSKSEGDQQSKELNQTTSGPKSSNHNENIAVFDEDGDISATSPNIEEITPFNFKKNDEIIRSNIMFHSQSSLPSSNHELGTKNAISEEKPLTGILKTEDRSRYGQTENICHFAKTEKPKVKIIITQPSPEKHKATNIPLAVEEDISISTAEEASPKMVDYPEELNPFDDEDDENISDKYTDNRKIDTGVEQISHKQDGNASSHRTIDTGVEQDGNASSPYAISGLDNHSTNPFGSDSEEDETTHLNNTHLTQSDSTTNRTVTMHNSFQKEDKSLNPFGEYDDIEDDRLSPTNPFAKYEDVPIQVIPKITEYRPELPPKTDPRIRRDSFSSTPVPHPRKSKQRHHGSSTSLHSMSSFPVPYPRSLLPSGSSGNIDKANSRSEESQVFATGAQERSNVHRDSLPEMSQNGFSRNGIMSSLPPISRLRFPRKKRTAPLPPSGKLPPSGASSSRIFNLIHPINGNSTNRSRSSSISPDGRPGNPAMQKNPPPRPPPPKKKISETEPKIKEKILQKI